MDNRLRLGFQVALVVLGQGGCSFSEEVSLGETIPVPIYRDFVDGTSTVVTSGVGQPVAGLNSLDDNGSPTLSADLLEIFFEFRRSEGAVAADIWTATRGSRAEAFAAPMPLTAANSSYEETSPSVSADGLLLWFASDRPGAVGGEGDVDIWRVERPSRGERWGEPHWVPGLNSPREDRPRSPGGGGQILPVSSLRDSVDEEERTFFVPLDEESNPSGPGVLVEHLAPVGQSASDGFLTEDALGLFYRRPGPNGDFDLAFAWRWSPEEPFESNVLLDALNTPALEGDPWLSADEELLFFTTTRRGNEEIFATRIQLPPRN